MKISSLILAMVIISAIIIAGCSGVKNVPTSSTTPTSSTGDVTAQDEQAVSQNLETGTLVDPSFEVDAGSMI